VHLHLRHASAWRWRAGAGARVARTHRRDRCPRRLARLDAARVDRRATRLGLRPNVAATGRNRRRGAARRATRRRCGHIGSSSDRRRSAGLRVAGHVVASRSDRDRCTTGFVRGVARRRGSGDIAIACRDDARSRATATIGLRRRTAAGRSTRVGVRTVARTPSIRRPTVGVIAVVADATPIPTGPVVADAPAIGDPRIVIVPDHDQRCGRSVVVAPRVPVRIPEHERALDVVVPAPGPVDAWERLDRLGVRVHVGDDRDLVAARQRLVADRLGRIAAGRRRVVLVLHVDIAVGHVRRRQVACLVRGLLVVRGAGRRSVSRRGAGSRVVPRAARERNHSEQGTGDQNESRCRHRLSVPRTRTRYNPADP
jgi:hypothetical protein